MAFVKTVAEPVYNIVKGIGNWVYNGAKKATGDNTKAIVNAWEKKNGPLPPGYVKGQKIVTEAVKKAAETKHNTKASKNADKITKKVIKKAENQGFKFTQKETNDLKTTAINTYLEKHPMPEVNLNPSWRNPIDGSLLPSAYRSMGAAGTIAGLGGLGTIYSNDIFSSLNSPVVDSNKTIAPDDNKTITQAPDTNGTAAETAEAARIAEEAKVKGANPGGSTTKVKKSKPVIGDTAPIITNTTPITYDPEFSNKYYKFKDEFQPQGLSTFDGNKIQGNNPASQNISNVNNNNNNNNDGLTGLAGPGAVLAMLLTSMLAK